MDSSGVVFIALICGFGVLTQVAYTFAEVIETKSDSVTRKKGV